MREVGIVCKMRRKRPGERNWPSSLSIRLMQIAFQIVKFVDTWGKVT